MTVSHFSRVLAVTLVWLQLLGPGFMWALEQRGVEVRRANQAVGRPYAGAPSL